MDYTKFSVEDLASDDSFINWVNGRDPEAEEFWHLFKAAHPELKVKIDQARALVLNLKRAQSIRHQDQQINHLWERISEQITTQEAVTVRKRKPVLAYVLVSLLILFVSGGGYILVNRLSSLTNDKSVYLVEGFSKDYIEEVNTTGSTIIIHLSDGSTVSLENNSRVKYKKSYKGESSRHVYLFGEAFFEVTKNPYQPFFVHANEVITKVIGTSFRVQALQNEKNVVVSVKTGKVCVNTVDGFTSEPNQEKKGVILFPNQQVVYHRQQEMFEKMLVETPEIIIPLDDNKDFVFDNTPVSEAFNTLQKAYGVEIIFDEEIMKNCFITAPLGSESLFEKLKIICQTIGASYEVVDAKVVIGSLGC